ncbi:MAG: hypothetical protein J7M21_04675, partial [Planctomycetes bacterium]|nr:hypothetical protein [Planctomycetota bacterium]
AGGIPGGMKQRVLDARSAGAAACLLAETFWRKAGRAVVCREDDYAGGLMASALAGRLACPLLFCTSRGLSAPARAVMQRLGVGEVILVGLAVQCPGAGGVKLTGSRAVSLPDVAAVLAWMRRAHMAVDYIAAVNPLDRTATVIRKLSLAGAILAAARRGMVVPLAYPVRWKLPFTGADCGKDVPPGLPPTRPQGRLRRGIIRLDGGEYPFVVAISGSRGRRCRLYVDVNGDGRFGGPGEGPLASGDVIELAGKRYSVTLGRPRGNVKGDVRLTWPTAEEIRSDLARCYKVLGGPPEYLCLVGLPDAIPCALVANGPGGKDDLLSDFPYADADADPFAEIAVGRLIAESASFATLYASRVITYDSLLDASWQDGAGLARWENTLGGLFADAGYRVYRHDVDQLRWLVPPTAKNRGRRARSIDANSPLTRVAVLAHTDHSCWKDIGHTFDWDSNVLLAPVLVESGGCLTAAMDRQADFRSVISRLFRNGAVGFAGNSRPGVAEQEQMRVEFWNAVLAGKTIGQAHRAAENSAVVTVLDNGEKTSGQYRYELYIRMLLGDPALAVHVPHPPRSRPAGTTVKGDIVTVRAPAKWWPVRIRVPEDWKNWRDKPLYVCRGAGTYPLRAWCSQGYDRERIYVNAEVRTARHIAAVTQVQQPPRPLGWRGRYYADEHADGTRTYRWRVRILDFDQLRGRIIHKVDHIDYRVRWQ